jgi:hypothetical protein
MDRVGRLMVARVDGGLALYPRALQSPVRPLTSVVYRLVGRNARGLKSCAVGGRVRCRVLESSVRITRHSERAIFRGCCLVPGSARTKTGMMVGRKSPCGKSSRIRNDNALASWDSHSSRPGSRRLVGVPPDRKFPDGLPGDSLEKSLPGGGSDIPFTSIGVGLAIASRSRTHAEVTRPGFAPPRGGPGGCNRALSRSARGLGPRHSR